MNSNFEFDPLPPNLKPAKFWISLASPFPLSANRIAKFMTGSISERDPLSGHPQVFFAAGSRITSAPSHYLRIRCVRFFDIFFYIRPRVSRCPGARDASSSVLRKSAKTKLMRTYLKIPNCGQCAVAAARWPNSSEQWQNQEFRVT